MKAKKYSWKLENQKTIMTKMESLDASIAIYRYIAKIAESQRRKKKQESATSMTK